MNVLFIQRNLSWLDTRIREAEVRIDSLKLQMGIMESIGSTTTQACRKLATMTEYLQLLNVRRSAVIEELRLAGKQG